MPYIYIFNVRNKLFISVVYIMFILIGCSYMVAHIFYLLWCQNGNQDCDTNFCSVERSNTA